MKVTKEFLEESVKEEHFFRVPNTTSTVCALILQNGFTLIGKSACIHPEDFQEDLGKSIARDNAISQLWELEGYHRVSNLHSQLPD